jgi:lipopolysaccharide transport system permease protein
VREEPEGRVKQQMQADTASQQGPGKKLGLPSTVVGIALRILRFRGLLLTLTARELKARYRGSVLGFFWSLANPLLLLGVYTLVFNVIFAPRFPGADPYAVFLITGLFPWIWLATALTEGTESLMSNAALIRKAVFPAEVLPVVSVLANLVHFALALPIVAVAIGVSRALGHPVGGWSVLLLPVVVAA